MAKSRKTTGNAGRTPAKKQAKSAKAVPAEVKQSENVGRPDVDAFADAMHRDNRVRGFVSAFSFSSDAEAECARIYKQGQRIIKLLTVQKILGEEFVQKM